MEIANLQKLIASQGADSYVMVDYENRNKNVVALLGEKMLTRKLVLIIPTKGKPQLIVHVIDTVYLRDEDIVSRFELKPYKTWQQMLQIEAECLKDANTVLMDISEYGLLPRVSLADHGSVEYVRSLGKQVKPSADILQHLSAVLSEEELELQKKACEITLKIKDEAFAEISRKIKQFDEVDELEIQDFIARRFHEEGLIYDELPLVAIGSNASDPHYTPTPEKHSIIKEGDLVLIDMWAKHNNPHGVYADITWMGYVGTSIPKVYQERFAIVKAARDAVISFLQKELPLRPVEAYEADDVAREVITKAGYGEYFLHRVGHNIAVDVSPHGPGANLDNYESHDFRHLIAGTSFSDEPGIYAPDFGMRSETDLHNHNGELLVLAGLQDEIIPILSLD